MEHSKTWGTYNSSWGSRGKTIKKQFINSQISIGKRTLINLKIKKIMRRWED
jgi:hypothetical protein